jgi:hypothetical protein
MAIRGPFILRCTGTGARPTPDAHKAIRVSRTGKRIERRAK